MGPKLIIFLAGLVAATGLASGQEHSALTTDPLDRLDNALLETRAGIAEATAASLAELRREVFELQRLLWQTEETLEQRTLAVSELEEKNKKLRETVGGRYGGLRSGSRPERDREPVESVPGQAGRAPQLVEEARRDATPHGFTIVTEWGRSPEVVAELPRNVSSLFGLVAVVAPGMPPDEVEALGKALRQTYNAYDNINIQIFDDFEAAKNYADLDTSSPEHLILTVSKHKNSKWDSILRFTNGVPVEVP